jgi:hypothetical protein
MPNYQIPVVVGLIDVTNPATTQQLTKCLLVTYFACGHGALYCDECAQTLMCWNFGLCVMEVNTFTHVMMQMTQHMVQPVVHLINLNL